jgi:hypothetical protein
MSVLSVVTLAATSYTRSGPALQGELPLPLEGDARGVRSPRRRPARPGRLREEIPDHGVLARVREKVAQDRWAGTGIEAQAKVDAR